MMGTGNGFEVERLQGEREGVDWTLLYTRQGGVRHTVGA
jgi:hypothetical protein